MSPLCLARLHSPSPAAVWNAGYFVSRCCRCGTDLIRRPQSPWRPVPKGFRIVWTPKPADYPDWEAFGRIAAVKAPEPPSGGETRIRLVASSPGPEAEARPPSFREWREARSA